MTAGNDPHIALAVFDLDGTCIDGQSGLLLSLYLARHGYLRLSTVFKLISWGARYKFHLPHAQDISREYIFKELQHFTVAQVDDLFSKFFYEVVKPRIRREARQAVEQARAEGCVCLLISATFDKIAEAAAAELGMDAYAATKMQQDGKGHYSAQVEGAVVSGEEKFASLEQWAKTHLNGQKWELVYAYGDHHSDIVLLDKALHPKAVCPGRTLRQYAKRAGWDILNWM